MHVLHACRCGLYYLPIMFVFSSVGSDLLAFCFQHPEASAGALLVPTPLLSMRVRGWGAHGQLHGACTTQAWHAPARPPAPLLRGCPQAGYDVLLFCLCGAVGQLFIFATIKRFGSLLNTLVTTTRKFFNILLSGALRSGTQPAYLVGGAALLHAARKCHCTTKQHLPSPARRFLPSHAPLLHAPCSIVECQPVAAAAVGSRGAGVLGPAGVVMDQEQAACKARAGEEALTLGLKINTVCPCLGAGSCHSTSSTAVSLAG